MPSHTPRIEKLRHSLETLRTFCDSPSESKRDIAGTVFVFVVAFEHAWKCLEDRVSDLGYSTRKIMPILETVLASGLIDPAQESVWLEMLEDKNLAWHVYSDSVATELIKRIHATHLDALESLHRKLRGR